MEFVFEEETIYNDLCKEVLTLKDAENSDDYWSKRDEWIKNLNAFIISNEMQKLSLQQVLQISAWVSTYRPLGLHNYLIILSRLNDYHKDAKNGN